MILDRNKTMDVLSIAALSAEEEFSITADNLDEIQLIRVKYDESEHDGDADYYILVENDYGTQFDLEELSDGELEFFCTEYNVEPIWDIENSAAQLREIIIRRIKSQEFSDGDMTYCVHSPDDIENALVEVKYIADGQICLYDYFSPDEMAIYDLDDLYIDDLIKIYNFQNEQS